jgi:hypothetical protein
MVVIMSRSDNVILIWISQQTLANATVARRHKGTAV